MKIFIIFGILFFGISCNIAYSKPADNNESEEYYDELDQSDAGVANQQMKPIKSTGHKESKAYFAHPNSTIIGTPGKDIVLQCEIINNSDEVVLWFKDGILVANEDNVVLPMHSVNRKTHQLTIINATDSNQGEYYCELQLEKRRVYTTVIFNKQQESGSMSIFSTLSISSLLLTPIVCSIQFVLRI